MNSVVLHVSVMDILQYVNQLQDIQEVNQLNILLILFLLINITHVFLVSIESVFARGNERWNGTDKYGRTVLPVHSPFKQSLEISSPSKDPVYFLAPGK